MSTNNPPTDIKGLKDMSPPFRQFLSGEYKRSFAYKTIKDRLPVIVTRIIDNMYRSKDLIMDNYGPSSIEELKQVIGYLSEMRSEIMTNKPIQPLKLTNTVRDSDAEKWNKKLENDRMNEVTPLTWFNSVWLLSECYMYRRIAQILSSTQSLATYDPFQLLKQDNLIFSSDQIALSAKYITSIMHDKENYSSIDSKNELIKLLKLNLWGNRCDSSLSGGVSVKVNGDPIKRIEMFETDLLIDDSSSVWELLNEAQENHKNLIVDIVLDNAGYELFTDLCLAIFLSTYDYAQKIRFYVKRIPWFISDVTENDFYWTINYMKASATPEIQILGHRCSYYLEHGRWTVEVESFWTEPFDFSEMKVQAFSLYTKIAEAQLVIFKGDLNYRKLLGDINWEYSTDLKTALRGFEPTNIVTLRTIKADLIVGLPHGKAEELFTKQTDWMTTGQYGLIQTFITNKNNNLPDNI